MEERREVAPQFDPDLATPLARKHQDGVDQAAQGGCRRRGRVGLLQRALKRLDPAAIEFRQVGMRLGDWLRHVSGRDLRHQCLLAAFEVAQFCCHRRAAVAVLDQLEQIADLTPELCPLLFQVGATADALAIGSRDAGDERGDEFLHEVWCQQPLLEADQHPLQQGIATQGAAVGAGAALDVVGAAKASLARHHRHRAVAQAAADQAGE